MDKVSGAARRAHASQKRRSAGDPAHVRRDKSLSKGEQTRRTIISRAVSIVSQVGYEGLSIGGLAQETKLSKSGLFAHFKSKEALQLGVMQEVINRYIQRVVQPALAAHRGEARLRTLFEKKLQWITGEQDSRGCLLQKASLEYNNRPGHAVRQRLVQALKDWREVLVRSCAAAIEAGDFRADLNAEQFAYEFEGITMMYQQGHGLMRDRAAEERAHAAFESLLERSRRQSPLR
jgi:AcrR family transcriptional regulator